MMARMYVELDDFRQSAIIAKNEIVKSVRGKRFLASAILVAIVWALITLVPFLTGKGWDVLTLGDMLSSYLSYANMFVVLVVGLIGSVALVSEYEERTALILFTRPVKKTTIFIGKFLASFLLSALLLLAYYIGVVAMTLIYHQTIPLNLVESFGMCCYYIVAATGISFIFSAVMKRSSICIIFSILALMVVIPIITTMIKGDTWYMLTTASESILTCIPEYVDAHNATIDEMYYALQKIYETILNSTDPETQSYAPFVQKFISMMSMFASPIAYPNLFKEAVVMLTWGLASSVIAWILFLKREF